jgi:hypothetical protein
MIERRALQGGIRAITEGKLAIEAHASVFNSLSADLGGFREIVRPGAFASVLGQDVRALWNHDPNIVLGRTKAGTLHLQQDAEGLLYRVDLPETQAARDLVVSIQRGDIDGSSFGFQVGQDEWINTPDGVVREIRSFSALYDVSPVTYPAYPAASDVQVALRSLDSWKQDQQAVQRTADRLVLQRQLLRIAELR